MRDFGSWFAEQGKDAADEAGAKAWMKCYRCGKEEIVDLAAYLNGDTGWYVDEKVYSDKTYKAICGGSQFCLL